MKEILESPIPPGMARLTLTHLDKWGTVLGRQSDIVPNVFLKPGLGRSPPNMCLIPPLGFLSGILITIPTVGRNKFALDIGALTGWEFALGIGTAAESLDNIALSSEITTFGGARASINPSVTSNVITFSHQWAFLTGASFAITEAGLFKNSILMMRHKYTTATNVLPTQRVIATFTGTY